jgi:hypothetical protein
MNKVSFKSCHLYDLNFKNAERPYFADPQTGVQIRGVAGLPLVPRDSLHEAVIHAFESRCEDILTTNEVTKYLTEKLDNLNSVYRWYEREIAYLFESRVIGYAIKSV